MDCKWFTSTFLTVFKFLQIKEGDLVSGENKFCRKSELSGPSFRISLLKLSRTQILRHSLDSNAFCMIQKTVCQSLKFLQIKDGGPNFWGEPNMQKVCTQILCHSLDFNAFGVIQEQFPHIFEISQIKEGGPKFWGATYSAESLNFWSSLLYFNFENFMDQNCLSFIIFQCILHDSGVFFSGFWNFYKLKIGDPISGGKQFCRKA